jgi:hypothetical protein
MILSGQVGLGEKLSMWKEIASRLGWHVGTIRATTVSAIADDGAVRFRRRPVEPIETSEFT